MLTDTALKPHHGHNLKRIREIMGLKQEALALELGDDWNQRKISLLEQKEIIDDATLDDLAKALKVSSDAIKNFNEAATLQVIASNNNGGEHSSAVRELNFQCTFNALDKFLEQVEENKRLYEALLKSEREKIALLEKLIDQK